MYIYKNKRDFSLAWTSSESTDPPNMTKLDNLIDNNISKLKPIDIKKKGLTRENNEIMSVLDPIVESFQYDKGGNGVIHNQDISLDTTFEITVRKTTKNTKESSEILINEQQQNPQMIEIGIANKSKSRLRSGASLIKSARKRPFETYEKAKINNVSINIKDGRNDNSEGVVKENCIIANKIMSEQSGPAPKKLKKSRYCISDSDEN